MLNDAFFHESGRNKRRSAPQKRDINR